MTFQEQVKELIYGCKYLTESKDESETELASIDKNLTEEIDTVINKKIETIFERK